MIRTFSLSSLRNQKPSPVVRTVLLISVVLIGLLIVAALSYAEGFGPTGEGTEQLEFVVRPNETMAEISLTLQEQGFVKHTWAFDFAALVTQKSALIRPGGYKLSHNMDVWSVIDTLSKAPYFAYVVIPEGLRKEQIAKILADTLGWTPEQIEEWNAAQAISPDFAEGVYFADTYLIPSDQAPTDVAARLRGKFQDAFAPYAAEATKKGIAWGDVLTLASLVEREAAKNDKALVAGILWNRINKDMLLQVDATLQYIVGNEKDGWWAAPNVKDKYLDSPFNTYVYVGLPPQPIANPSIASVEAVLNPDTTSCLYYLHDTRGRIHCSPTYKGHLSNVNRYLR